MTLCILQSVSLVIIILTIQVCGTAQHTNNKDDTTKHIQGTSGVALVEDTVDGTIVKFTVRMEDIFVVHDNEHQSTVEPCPIDNVKPPPPPPSSKHSSNSISNKKNEELKKSQGLQSDTVIIWCCRMMLVYGLHGALACVRFFMFIMWTAFVAVVHLLDEIYMYVIRMSLLSVAITAVGTSCVAVTLAIILLCMLARQQQPHDDVVVQHGVVHHQRISLGHSRDTIEYERVPMW